MRLAWVLVSRLRFSRLGTNLSFYVLLVVYYFVYLCCSLPNKVVKRKRKKNNIQWTGVISSNTPTHLEQCKDCDIRWSKRIHEDIPQRGWVRHFETMKSNFRAGLDRIARHLDDEIEKQYWIPPKTADGIPVIRAMRNACMERMCCGAKMHFLILIPCLLFIYTIVDTLHYRLSTLCFVDAHLNRL